jgi:hypothetical protein
MCSSPADAELGKSEGEITGPLIVKELLELEDAARIGLEGMTGGGDAADGEALGEREDIVGPTCGIPSLDVIVGPAGG